MNIRPYLKSKMIRNHDVNLLKKTQNLKTETIDKYDVWKKKKKRKKKLSVDH